MNCTKYAKGLGAHVLFKLKTYDIVSKIISQLTLKEAVRMNTISTKLRRAWIHHPIICFDNSIVFGSSDRPKRFIDTIILS